MKRILVVDDDATVGDLIKQALGEYDVVRTYNGDEALAFARTGTRVDLVITDYLMPTMMGDELLGRLREQHPTLKALVVTGHGAALQNELSDWWSAQPHLAKPFTISALRDSVFQLIGPPTAH